MDSTDRSAHPLLTTQSLDISPGRAVFNDLVANSDAVFSNLRGDQSEKLRIRYDDLAPLNEQLVCISLSGFGNTGPQRKGALEMRQGRLILLLCQLRNSALLFDISIFIS